MTTGPILTTSGTDARMRIVESNQAERIANELAALLAQEHRLLVHEQEKRAQVEAIAPDPAVQLALDRAELAREREAAKVAIATATPARGRAAEVESRTARARPRPRSRA